ncbi:uncharacterized protein LOC144861262 [Branchiostoma floridae x Branchiostoma japonicum]
MATENRPPLAALRKKTHEHIANSRERHHPDYGRALTLNLLEEQKLRTTVALLDRQKTAEISKFRLEHRAFLSRAKSATEQLSRESLGESRGIRRPWSEFGMARVQFQSAEARLVHGGSSTKAGRKPEGSPVEDKSRLRLKGHGFYTHCHHCAKRYIRSTVAGPGRARSDCEHDDDMYMSSRSVTPEKQEEEQITDKDRQARHTNPGFTVARGQAAFKRPLQNAKKLSRPTTAATDTAVITLPVVKPPRPSPGDSSGRRRSCTSKPSMLKHVQDPSKPQFTLNVENVTTPDDYATKNQDKIATGINGRNDTSAPSGQHQNDSSVVMEYVTKSLPTSPRGRWLWAFRAFVNGNKSRQRPEIPGNQDTPTTKNVAKPKKGTKKNKRKGKNAKSKDKIAKTGDKTGRDKNGEKSRKQAGSFGHDTEAHKTLCLRSIFPVPAKARWLWAMRAVLRAKNKRQRKDSQKPITEERNAVIKTARTENSLPCSPKDRWFWAMTVIISHRKVQSRPKEHLQTAIDERAEINPKDTQQNTSTAKGRWLWAMKTVLKQTARRRHDVAGSPTKPNSVSVKRESDENAGLPSSLKQRWKWAMRAVLKNKDKFEKQEQPSLDEKHVKKTSKVASFSKTKTAKTETVTSSPVTQKRGRRNSTAVNSFLGAVSYKQLQTSGIFGKPGSKTRSGRHRSLKFDPLTLLKQTKEQEEQKESYEDMMEKFKKLRNCRYLRWRRGQDPYLNDTFDMVPQTGILTLPLPNQFTTTTRNKLVRKPSFRQAHRSTSFFSTSVVAVTAVSARK